MNSSRCFTLSALAIAMTVSTGCAKPDLMQPGQDHRASQPHWFSQVMRSPAQQVDYLGPALPYQAFQRTSQPGPESDQATSERPAARPPLSAGDRIRMFMPADPLFNGVFNGNDGAFNGIFEIDIDGSVKFPYLKPLGAAGLTLDQLEAEVNQALEAQGLYRAGMARASLVMLQWAPITVFISGAVFQPGQHTINQRSAEDRAQAQNHTSGDLPLDRLLPTALRAAGGVRPDADISAVQLRRGNKTYILDISGIVLGHAVLPIALMDGDQISISSVGAPQRELMRASGITPPGIRVFISNLTVPATNNASSAIGKHATSLPYGARLHNAVVSGNCAGGSASTNSDRFAVLVTQDPHTQRPVTVEREIEGLLRAPDRVDINPYLMPNDSVVCYDSNVSNVRDIARSITDILLPLSLLF